MRDGYFLPRTYSSNLSIPDFVIVFNRHNDIILSDICRLFPFLRYFEIHNPLSVADGFPSSLRLLIDVSVLARVERAGSARSMYIFLIYRMYNMQKSETS